MKIPLVDLQAQYLTIKDEIQESIQGVLNASNYIGGMQISKFEESFAKLCHTKYCVGVGNGTDSLVLILKALDLKFGDKVLVPANSFIASSEAISLAGCDPIFIDCDKDDYTIDPKLIELELENDKEKKIKAMIVVHLYGCPAKMDELLKISKKYSVFLIEDSAQAHIAEYKNQMIGSFGIASSFSFYPGKNLGAYGDAGAVCTNDEGLAIKIRKLANHGRIDKYNHEIEGMNSRLDTIQAAVLNVKLKYLENWTNRRIVLSELYQKYLKSVDVELLKVPEHCKHVFHLFVIRVKNRERIQSYLAEKGIQTGIHYPIALPYLKAYDFKKHNTLDFPISFKYQSEILSLPIYPELEEQKLTYITQSIQEGISIV